MLRFRHFTTTARALAAPPEAPSLVKSFLYGSEKGQELQREMEQSYSKVLARGKYVHKLNTHFVKPDKIDEYVELMYVSPSLYIRSLFCPFKWWSKSNGSMDLSGSQGLLTGLALPLSSPVSFSFRQLIHLRDAYVELRCFQRLRMIPGTKYT
jgi:hypothetical protein